VDVWETPSLPGRLEKQPMKIIRKVLQDTLSFNAPMPESMRRKKLLGFMLRAIMLITALIWTGDFLNILLLGPSDDPGNKLLLFGTPIIWLGLAIVLIINNRIEGNWASFIFIIVTFLSSMMDVPSEVAEGRSLLYFSIPIVLSSLLIRPWASFVTAGLACTVNIIYVSITPDTAVNNATIAAYIILAGIMWLATSSLESSVHHMDVANHALRESEEHYRTLVETSPDMVVVSDMLGTIEVINRAGLKMLGYERKPEILGKKTWDLITSGERQQTKELFRKTFITDTIKDSKMEVLACKKDGSTVYVELNNSLVINESTGKPIKIIAVGRDITLRKEAERQLLGEKSRLEDTVREGEEAYQNLVEHSSQGLALLQSGRIIKANTAFAKMCGVTLPELYAIDVKKLRERIHPDDVATMQTYIEERFTGATSNYHEVRFLAENGETRWLEFMPLWFNFMGQPALQLTVIDRTKRKTTELALAESVEQLKQLEASLRDAKDALEIRVADRTAELNQSREQLRELTHQIVSSLEDERRRVSRELHDEAGQILIGLKYRLGEALSSLPHESRDYQEARELISTAMNGTDLAMQKIRALAHALRPPTLDIAGVNLSLQSLCRECSEQISLPIHYKGVELTGLGDEISISLYRILQEGLTNIVKHAPQTTRIKVTLARTKKTVTLTIEDNGRGFHPDPSKKGIGLLGIEERLSLLGGQLDIQQSARNGTRLKAIIPVPTAIGIQG
jgi:PAS domain S-box-containing protein